jgi:Spy/CpxP family protein refolding chaperone
MRGRRASAIGGVAAALVGGGAAALAATNNDGDKAESAVLNDAAKRLGVPADKLKDALSKAEATQLDARLDEAVKDGDLTQKQADQIKKDHAQFGGVLGGPGVGGHGPGPGFGGPRLERHHFGGPGFAPGPGGPGGILDDVAKSLGISVDKLFTELRDGKTLAQVAKAHDKSLADVKKAAEDALDTRLDKAVKDKDLTQKQADQIRKGIGDAIDHFGERRGPGPGPGFGPPPPGFGHGFGHRPGTDQKPEAAPGSAGGAYGPPTFTQ